MRLSGERGVVLGIVIITAIIFGIAAFGLLSMAVNQARQATFVSQDRARARYAAESGLVMAMQELWVDQNDCVFGPYNLDTNGDGANETTVTVTRSGICPPPPNTLSTLQAKVTF